MILKERWTNVDWAVLGVITTIATVIRSIGLGVPKALVFDEFYYVPDACRYLIHIADICGPREFTWMQPPLGKWMIAFGLQVLGPNRYGWRLAPLIAGVVTIALVYVLGRCLFESRVPGVVAAGLLTFDFMHFVQSRTAMLDVFLMLFVTLAVLLAVIDRDDPRTGIVRPWRWGAGAALGAAMATKWSAFPLLVAVAALALLWDRRRRRDGDPIARGAVIGSLAIGFVVLPLIVYVISYAGRFDGSLLVAPWSEGSWFADWWERQAEMIEYHTQTRRNTNLLAHPSASPAWSWLLLKRPMALYFDAGGGLYREILAMGHVLMWPLAIPAVGWLAAKAIRLRDSRDAGSIALVAFLAAYLPWFVLTLGDQDPYVYYMLPGLPFMYLGFGVIAERLRASVAGRIAIGAVALAAIGLWAFYLPLLSAAPISVESWRQRILFHDCVAFPNAALDDILKVASPDLPLQGLDRPIRPSDRLFPTGTKSTGWCWI